MGGVGDCCIGNISAIPRFEAEKPKNWFSNLFGGSIAGTGNEEYTQRIAEELAEKRKIVRNESRKLEQQLIGYVNASLDNLLEEVSRINEIQWGDNTLSLNMKEVVRKNNELKEKIMGCISDKVDDRLVLTDVELSAIMAERDDKKRSEELENFCSKIQREALMSFRYQIKKTMKRQLSLIRKEIEGRINDVGNSLDESVKVYTELLENREDHIKMQKSKAEYMFQQGVCDCFLSVLSDIT